MCVELLNASLLQELWPDLVLSHGCRALWERRFPTLAALGTRRSDNHEAKHDDASRRWIVLVSHRDGVVGRDQGDRRRPIRLGATRELGLTETRPRTPTCSAARPPRTTSTGLLLVGACIAARRFACAGCWCVYPGKNSFPVGRIRPTELFTGYPLRGEESFGGVVQRTRSVDVCNRSSSARKGT